MLEDQPDEGTDGYGASNDVAVVLGWMVNHV